MLSCPCCGKALRRDESLSVAETSEGTQGVCPRCKASITGQPEPEPRIYPVGCRMPRERGTADAPLKICGLCRQALFWDDNVRSIRVPENDQGVEPGVYHACRDCLAAWKPAVAQRLKEELGLELNVTKIAGNLLL